MVNNKSSMKFIVILTLVIIGLITAFVVLDNNTGTEDEKAASSSGAPAIEGQPTIGEKDAPVQIVEFGDYLCPACKAWSERVYPLVKQEYIDAGKANLTFINVLFHGDDSELASTAGEAVYKQAPDKFWDFSKQLFAAQPEKKREGWLTEEIIFDVAKQSVPSLDIGQLQEDMESEEIKQKVDKDERLVKEHNVQLTPTIMINGEMVEDPFDYEDISNKINQALEASNG